MFLVCEFINGDVQFKELVTEKPEGDFTYPTVVTEVTGKEDPESVKLAAKLDLDLDTLFDG